MKRESFIALLIAMALGLLLAAGLLWPRWQQQQQQRTDPPPATTARPRAVAAPTTPPATSTTSSQAAAVPPPPLGACDEAMVHVEGLYCPYVAHRCESWLGAPPKKGSRRSRRESRCERYRNEMFCEGRPAALSFCIDRYEYPNLPGAKPAVLVDYRQAKRACTVEGKRLCEAEEWILACEGKRTLPYPTGLVRDPAACNIDRRPRQPNRRALAVPADVSVEVERLDQRLPAGALSDCLSPFGAMDTAGNVAEWVHNREGKAHRAPWSSSIAGGHWARSPATCRQLDGDHEPTYRSYRVGFRCCADTLDGRPARRMLAAEARLPRRRAILP